MLIVLLALSIMLIVVCVTLRNENNKLREKVDSAQAALTAITESYNKTKSELAKTTTERDSLLRKYASVIDAEAEAKDIIDAARKNADSLIWESHVELEAAREKAERD